MAGQGVSLTARCRRLLPRSIRSRLTLWFSLLLFGVLISFGVILYAALRQGLSQADARLLTAHSAQVRAALNVQDGQLTVQDVAEGNGGAVAPGAGEPWQLWDGNGQLAATAPGPALPVSPALLQAPLRGSTIERVLQSGTGEDFLVRIQPVTDGGQLVGVLAVGVSLAGTEGALRLLLEVLLLAIPVTVLIAGLGGLWLARRALAPIAQLTQAAQAIQAGDLSRRLAAPAVDDEVGRLAATLNAMLARLEEAFRRQQRFTADASHELRTPLTIIRATAEEGRSARSRVAAQNALTSIEEETQRLEQLVAALLTLARAEADTLPIEQEVVVLHELLADVVDQLAPLAQRQGVTLHRASAEPITVIGDAARLVQLLLNLVGNAIRYTLPGGNVQVSLQGEGRWATLRVRDDGIGIAPDALPHIFERFYRADAAHRRGGVGLGLSIAHWIVEAHQGEIAVESAPGQGTTFTVRLPAELALQPASSPLSPLPSPR